MPQNCNGLSLIDDDKDFCKLNCAWARKSAGRPALPEKKKYQKKKRSMIQNPKSICLVLEKDHLDFIKNQALQLSVQEGHLIEPNELIRDALQRAFPTPKQFDMFGARK